MKVKTVKAPAGKTVTGFAVELEINQEPRAEFPLSETITDRLSAVEAYCQQMCILSSDATFTVTELYA